MVADVQSFAVVLAASIPALGAFLLGWLNLRRQVLASSQITQINNAVNHQPSSAPTLIHRVLIIERNIADHAEWSHEALSTIASQVGCTLPPSPIVESRKGVV
jgi:hypothetical protein